MRTAFILLTVLLVFPACKKDSDNCTRYGKIDIGSVRYIGTSRGEAGQQGAAFFDVTCGVPNGCYSINKFILTKDKDTIVVGAESVLNTCIACILEPISVTKNFVFTPSTAGTYYMKWKGIPNRIDTVFIR
ncbi:hypothetical protein HGH93_03325 [Chitinophaga polysaccharea]|uniref:hypothetical protein n=1 Tax=Chitinophaga TaxID=79328 RepID=UPI001455892A|nr:MULTISPECIES: hypothetical protein [Chitinophaga]NLR57111.1 hypothetical protein [Chitinophaga polysaccharea]NLU91764.1 hypothetical protein [Chitinophaga sp. Ak27]